MKKVYLVVCGVLFLISSAQAASKKTAPNPGAACELYYQVVLEQARAPIPHDIPLKEHKVSLGRFQDQCDSIELRSRGQEPDADIDEFRKACKKKTLTFEQVIAVGDSMASPDIAEATSCAHWVKNQINASMNDPTATIGELKKALQACQRAKHGTTCQPSTIPHTSPGFPGNLPGFQDGPGGAGGGGEGKIYEDPNGGSGGGGEGKANGDNGGAGGGGEATGTSVNNVPPKHPRFGPRE